MKSFILELTVHCAKTEECKKMEKVLLENNGNTARHIPGPLPLRGLSRVDGFLLLSL